MLAAQTHFPFSRLHLCEKENRKYEALVARVNRVRADSQMLRGDANQCIDQIVREIPKRSLSLAFLDPYGLHLEFETLRKLSDIRADMVKNPPYM